MHSSSLLTRAVGLFVVLASSGAAAQTGVSDDRVSLPDGPGSLDGLGDNASTDGNMGQMQFDVPIDAPGGFEGATPALSLVYSSGAGSSSAGIGWSLAVPFVERMTTRGLPEYTATDRFVANGSEQLVQVGGDVGGNDRVYRARHEGGFVRYHWHDSPGGDEGYWRAENPDGTVSFFGADETGAPLESARVRSADGVFRYLLAVTVSPWGHKVTYDYSRYTGTAPLLDFVGWGYDRRSGEPTMSMSFDYEARPDPISDARGGFNELLLDRLTGIRVFSGGAAMKSYLLAYDDGDDAGGLSRLVSVRQFGSAGGELPNRMTFDYSRAVVGASSATDGSAPFLVTLGSIGFNALEAGQGTLMDMNGDSLPDLLVTPVDGSNHRIYLSQLDAQGRHTFAAPTTSIRTVSRDYQLANTLVQELDFDGDGFSDLVNYATGRVLVNKGNGDWEGEVLLSSSGGVDSSDFAESSSLSASDGELESIKFFDYDNDRRMDVLKAVPESTTVLRAVGGGGYVAATGIEPLDASFGVDNLELADMNGDGMLDPVLLQSGGISLKVNLGRGHWTQDWLPLANAPAIGAGELPFTSLEDLNGDGIDDLVTVQADTIRYAINRAGQRFDAVQVVSSAGGVTLPLRDDSTSVLFADMNGNGSNDVVWIDRNGVVTYLELFPVRPNLLTRIDNGLGAITDVTYTTSALNRARDGGAGWTHPVPMSMLVVDAVDTYAKARTADDDIHDVTTVRYADGFYDGAEKQWRGFGTVTRRQVGDTNQESLTIVERYDLGAPDAPPPALDNGELWNDRAPFAGRIIERELSGDDGPYERSLTTWELCDVAGVPAVGLDFPVQWVCATRSETVSMEGRPQSEWVVTASEQGWDGYGNVVAISNLGVTSTGGGACEPCAADGAFGAPCGATCEGDERFVETSYVDPDDSGVWNLRLPWQSRSSVAADGRVTIDHVYYDGEAFVGLPAGQATRGARTRATRDLDGAGGVIETERFEYDNDGNVVGELGPVGTVADGKRRRATWSADGLDMLSESADVTNADGVVRRLRRDFSYDDVFGRVASATPWFVDGEDRPPVVRFGYDEFGRLSWRADAGDSADAPTVAYAYELGSRTTVTRTRWRTGSGFNDETTCADGLGRITRSSARVADGRWLVTDETVFNKVSKPLRTTEDYEAADDDCDRAPPAGTPVTSYFYDSRGREVRVVRPDEGDTTVERRVVFGPLSQQLFSEDDTAAEDAHHDTPSTVRFDGLGRVVSVDRPVDTAGGGLHRFTYDDLGLLSGFVDPRGTGKTQTRDTMGRVLTVQDSERGRRSYEYDGTGNIVREEDGAGRILRRTYDELGRKVEEWDDADRAGTLAEFFYDRHPDCPMLACENGAGAAVGARTTTEDDGVVLEAVSYDERRRAVATQRNLGGKAFLFEVAYDNAGQAVEEVFPDGRRLTHVRDGLGRDTQIPGYVDSIEYSPRGLLQAYTLANGVRTAFTANARRELTGILATGRAGPVTDLSIARDRTGNTLAVTDRSVAAGAKASQTAAFTYDALERLVSAVVGAGGSAGAGERIDFAYDDLERLTSQTSSEVASRAHVGDYAYDGTAPRAVTRAGDTAWSYDGAGRASARGDDDYTFSAQGRLVRVQRAGEDVSRFSYDALGGRVAQRVGDSQRLLLAANFQVEDGVGRLQVRVGSDVVVEEDAVDLATRVFVDDGDGRIDARDAWAQRDTEDVAALLRSSARRLLVENGADRQYLHRDHLGSTIAVSDGDGAVRQRFAYYPYGAVRFASAGQTEDASFAGARVDDTGLLLFGERALAPREGRWLTPDPAFDLLDENALSSLGAAVASYSYADNNPSTFLDQTGLAPFTSKEKLAIATGIGVALAVGVTVALLFTPAGPAVAVAAAAVMVKFGIAAAIGGAIKGLVTMVCESVNLNKKLSLMKEVGEVVDNYTMASEVGGIILKSVFSGVTGFFSGPIAAGISAATNIGISVASYQGYNADTRQGVSHSHDHKAMARAAGMLASMGASIAGGEASILELGGRTVWTLMNQGIDENAKDDKAKLVERVRKHRQVNKRRLALRSKQMGRKAAMAKPR